MEIQEELISVTQQRLMATLQSDKATLSSEEARQVLGHISGEETDRKQNVQRIEKEIDALQETEQIFMEKLRAYQQTDVEWKALLSRQESFRDDLTRRKREEAEARKRLDDAIRMVSEAKANLVAVSSPLRNVEHVVRKHASEIDQVKFTLSRKQERVRQALRKKASMSNGAIQLQYLSEEDLAALRRKEMQLTGESEQLATMVARMSARAEKLRSRAAVLDSLQDSSSEGSPQEAPPSLGVRPVGL
jgi:myosin heavy subunit